MRTPNVPKGARRIKTYQELHSYLKDFADGKIPFLWVYGRPGLGKTEGIKAMLGGKKVLLYSSAKPSVIQFHIEAYKHLAQPIIINDAEGFLAKPDGVGVINALTETNSKRLMSHVTSSKLLTDAEVPKRYYTTSPLCVLANSVTSHAAIMSRASALLHFDPSNEEIHRQAAGWLWDQEIHDWFGENVPHLEPIDVRWYKHAATDKENRRDWRRLASHHLKRETKTVALVQRLENDAGFELVEDKVNEYLRLLTDSQGKREKGASRETYFRIKKRLEKSKCAGVPSMLVRGKKPEQVTHEDLLRANAKLNGEVAGDPGEPDEGATPVLDVPTPTARERFEQGGPAQPKPKPKPPTLDDNVPWESP